MSDPRDPDAEMIDKLRSLFESADPVPGEVTAFAKAALGWRRIDAELAELLQDSALESRSAMAVRAGEPSGRWLSFEAKNLSIDLEVQEDAENRLVLGQLVPTNEGATVELQLTDASLATLAITDSLGRFRLQFAAGVRVRLRVLRPDVDTPVETSWFSL